MQCALPVVGGQRCQSGSLSSWRIAVTPSIPASTIGALRIPLTDRGNETAARCMFATVALLVAIGVAVSYRSGRGRQRVQAI
jgi:hypothetical protein